MILYTKVNEEQAFNDWSGIIGEAVGFDPKSRKDQEKAGWMSTMMAVSATMNERKGDIENLIESYGSQAPVADFPGMGAATFPSDPGTGIGASDSAFFDTGYQRGSGDMPGTKLGIAMNVAAYTIGLELLPVIPMDVPVTMFGYLDHVYADGNLNEATNTPTYIEISGGTIGSVGFDYTDFNKGDYIYITQLDVNAAGTADAIVNGAPAIRGQFYGRSRIEGNLILGNVAIGTLNTGGNFTESTTSSISDITLAGATGAANVWVASTGVAANITALAGTPAKFSGTAIGTVGSINLRASLVNTFDEHIAEYSNNSADISANGPDRFTATREQGEKGTENSIALQFTSTSVEAGTVEVIANITRTQLRDLKAYGVDGMAQIYRASQNQLTQTINKDILRQMFRLGVTSHTQLKASQNLDLNLFLGEGTDADKPLSEFGLEEFVDIQGNSRVADFPAVKNGETNSSAENLYSRQRRLYSRILYAANVISTVGRHGKGNMAVVNTNIASALQDCKGFVQAPSDNTITSAGDNLYFIGMANNVAIYCDPNMKMYDTRIMVGRKGTPDDPGLKMFIYQLAESVETISETSMSPKILVSSRYRLFGAGLYPQAQYLTFGAYMGFSDNEWA